MAYSAATDACLLAQHQAVLAWHTAQRSGVDVTELLKLSRIEEQFFSRKVPISAQSNI